VVAAGLSVARPPLPVDVVEPAEAAPAAYGAAPAEPLRAAAKKHLRGLGNRLPPHMRIGKDRVSEGVLEHLSTLLERHELVKVKLLDAAPGEALEVAGALCAGTGAELVHEIGGVILLFRRSTRDPVIVLPGERRHPPRLGG
jgi:RNA-binding protein